MARDLAFILVGDHLGQVKKILYPSNEITILAGLSSPSSSNPVVSIEPVGETSKQLIAYRDGQVYIYDCIQDAATTCKRADDALIKALSISEDRMLLVYDRQIDCEGVKGDPIVQKRGHIYNAGYLDNKVAFVGKDISLKVVDVKTKKKLFEADDPEKDWLGIKPDIFVADLDFICDHRIATCSKSDSVIRIYDIKSKPKPVISVDISQTAFNEHADSARFISIASTDETGHSIVVGSNVGQMLAIDLRFNAKQTPKKKLQPRTYKILGGFKGARGASIKDVKVIPVGDQQNNYKVISCCLDRYLRIHNFTRTSRHLDRHVYMTTKPFCCSPVLF